MKMSELKEGTDVLSIEQKNSVVFDLDMDFNEHAEFALLLGGMPDVMLARAKKAAEIYFENRVDFIIPTGGVCHKIEGEIISEAHYMTRALLSFGVPEDRIIIENEARTTKENMICSLLVMHRKMGYNRIKNIVIVTSPPHIKRSMGIAKRLLPQQIKLSGICSDEPRRSREHWTKYPDSVEKIEKEAGLLKRFVDTNSMDDFEF